MARREGVAKPDQLCGAREGHGARGEEVKRPEFEWTEASVDKLREMHAAGATCAAIGHVLRVTKSAVVGKARRLKLTARPNPIARLYGPPRPSPVPRGRIVKPQAARKHEAPAAPRAAPSRPESLAPLAAYMPEATRCRWPLWDHSDTPNHAYCPKDRLETGSYCPSHQTLGTTRPAIAEQQEG